jgi:hypothetical protein
MNSFFINLYIQVKILISYKGMTSIIYLRNNKIYNYLMN